MLTAYVIVTLSMSIVSILFYGVDKIKSFKDVARIPEIVLIAVSAMGGVFGTMLGMIFFDHKSNMSRKWHFFITIIVSFLVQLALFFVCAGVISGGI